MRKWLEKNNDAHEHLRHRCKQLHLTNMLTLDLARLGMQLPVNWYMKIGLILCNRHCTTFHVSDYQN